MGWHLQAEAENGSAVEPSGAASSTPEVEMYCYLLVIMYLVDQKQFEQVGLSGGRRAEFSGCKHAGGRLLAGRALVSAAASVVFTRADSNAPVLREQFAAGCS